MTRNVFVLYLLGSAALNDLAAGTVGPSTCRLRNSERLYAFVLSNNVRIARVCVCVVMCQQNYIYFHFLLPSLM